MFFGDPIKFGVEIFEEGTSPAWLGFGRMCLHLSGNTFGDLNESHCSLWHPVERIAEVARNLPKLWSLSFEGHTDQELFAFLDAALFSGEIAADAASDEGHDFLTNTCESFDGEKSFVFCDTNGVVRVVWQGRDGRICSAHVSKAEFVLVADQLSKWFKSLCQHRSAVV